MLQIEKINSYKKNSIKLSTSGQPTEAEFKIIANEGFDVVINLRPEIEMQENFDEKVVVESLGMKYIQIPMTFDTLNTTILSTFFQTMEEYRAKKMIVHCRHNIRVSVLLALYRIIKLGWSREDAFNKLKEMMNITPELKLYLDEHISNFNK